MNTTTHRGEAPRAPSAPNENARPLREGVARMGDVLEDARNDSAGILLARLERVIPAGPGRWYARCPAHEDRSPSLSIRETGERVLIHCFAGCDPDAVLKALGLGWRDLYPDSWECARRRPWEAVRDYAKGTLARVDPLDHERLILRIAAADLRAGKELSVEDRARVQVARERLGGGGR